MISKDTDSPLSPINLQGGWPTPHLHPTKALEAASVNVLSRGPESDTNLIYGLELGQTSFRKHIAGWLSETYNPDSGPVTTDRIAITNGASNCLATVLQKFSEPGYTRNIWMVEPVYFLACPIFTDAGFGGRLRGVPEDNQGIDLEFLRRELQAVEDSREDGIDAPERKTVERGYPHIFKHIIYLVPTFSNPSAKIMSIHHRQELVKIAREFDALITTDDVYDVLRWPAEEGVPQESIGAAPPRLVDIDRMLKGTQPWGNTVSNGSFSKIVAPGMRVGWCEGTPQFIQAMGTVGATVSGGCQGHFASLMIENLISSGALRRHISDVLIPTYRKRHRAMVDAIKENLYPLGVRLAMGDSFETQGSSEENKITMVGGFFLYILFPEESGLPSVSEIAKLALEEYSLRIAPGEIFNVKDDHESAKRAKKTFGQGARLCWAWNEEEVLVEGIERLATAIRQAQMGI